MSGIYLKNIGKRGKISIWVVDGEKVRRDLDEEFTNFGQHFRFPVIPEYELWLDREASPDEKQFFIDHLLTEWRLMKGGMPYKKAIDFADAVEARERKRTLDLKKIAGKGGAPLASKVHLKLLGKIKKISVWLIIGRLVRSDFDIDFTEGGHDLIYNFVPKNEVWIDDDIIAKERPYVLLHELFERLQMSKGLPYCRAHAKASRLEWQSRHDAKKLKKNLVDLGWKK